MKRMSIFAALWLAACLTALPKTNAQNQPAIGYVYPAGGQRGVDVDVVVGGQYLDGVHAAYVCGQGVQAEVIEHIKPMPRKTLIELGQKLRDLNKRRQNKEIGWIKMDAEFTAFAKSKGLEEMNLAAFNKLRLKLKDPKRQLNAQLAEQVTLRITIADDTKLGNRELRLGTPVGLTGPLVFQVGQYPEYNESEPNDQTPDARIIDALPTVINGQVMPGDVDRFRFKASKGTRLVAAVDARRLIPYLADAVPGWFQATLSLHDAGGNEVAFTDDFGFHPDPVICYHIPEDGEYVLVIHDAIFRGREDFIYRMTLGETPFITSVFPLGGKAGKNSTVHLNGWNLPTNTLKVEAKGKQPSVVSVFASGEEWESNRLPFALNALKDIREVEPNEHPSQSQPVTLPLIVNGCIGKNGDRDVYRFTGHKGQRVIAEVRARRLGSELDSLLKLTDAVGHVLSSNDDFQDKGAGLITHQADSFVSFTLPKHGIYFVHVSDTRNHGGKAYGYRLRISPPRPDFSLRVVPSTINARPGMTLPLTVYAMRQDGFNGQIDLRLTDMPLSFSLSGGWIPAGQDQIQLSLTVPRTPRAEPVPLHLEGRALVGGHQIHHKAVPADDMMQAFFYRHLVPMWQTMVSVKGRERRGPGIRLLNPVPVKLPVVGTAQVRLATPRGPFLSRLQLELLDPPKGISIKGISPDSMGAAIMLDIQGDGIKPGQQGNLIIKMFITRSWEAKDGKKRSRRVSIGILPAIPYETITAPVNSNS